MKLRRLTGVAAGLTLLAAGAVACSDDESVFNAEVGECIESISDLPGDLSGELSGDISELPEAECTEDHEGEIFFLFEHEGDDDDFPGYLQLQAEASVECNGGEFEDFIGVRFTDTSIDVALVTPSEEAWGDGDRETICIAFVPDEEVDESLEGEGENFPDEFVAENQDEIDALVESCEGGAMADCDALFGITETGSLEEEIGATCGGLRDIEEVLSSTCVDAFG